MSNKGVLGVFRERSHSPRREYDDEAILKETAARLAERLGGEVPLLHPGEFLNTGLDIKPELIFFMCEEEPCLERLKSIARSMDCILVNSAASVENTFRTRMLEILSDQAFFPASRMVGTGPEADVSGFSLGSGGLWLKRGDFHAIEDDDVVFVSCRDELAKAIQAFAGRGIQHVVVQEHVPGDIIKFYSVTDFGRGVPYWFKWFYHKDQDLRQYPFDREELFAKCQLAGRLLGLEIFGGDAIVRPDGRIFVIDVNAWPSFALFRKEAAEAISALIADKMACKGCNVTDVSAGRLPGACRVNP